MDIEDRMRHMARKMKDDGVNAAKLMPNRDGYYAKIFWEEYENYVPLNDLPKAKSSGLWHTGRETTNRTEQ